MRRFHRGNQENQRSSLRIARMGRGAGANHGWTRIGDRLWPGAGIRERRNSRLSPRTPSARRSFGRATSRLAPFALFAREFLRKMGRKWAVNYESREWRKWGRKPTTDGLRSGSRLSPRTPSARRSFGWATSRLAPSALFAREILRKRPVFDRKSRFWGPKRPENGVFRRF